MNNRGGTERESCREKDTERLAETGMLRDRDRERKRDRESNTHGERERQGGERGRGRE